MRPGGGRRGVSAGLLGLVDLGRYIFYVFCLRAMAKEDRLFCPYCKEEILDGALRCKHCHATLGAAYGAPQNDPGPVRSGARSLGADYDASRPFFDAGNLQYVFLSYAGRLNRAKYWAAFGVIFAAQVAAAIVSETLLALVCLACVYPSVVVGIKRFHDLGKSGHWMWFSLVPLFNLYTAFLVMVVRGDRGPNRFGPDLLA
jgi:uncharacterized membrane protein YhaH (DUF805 family)